MKRNPFLPFLLFLLAFSPPLAAGSGTTSVAVSPDGGLLLVGAQAGIFRSTDGGASWKHVMPGGEGFVVASIGFDPHSSSVYASTSDGLFRSDDRGATWSDKDLLGGSIPGRILFDPARKGTMYVASADGLYVTTDGGVKWKDASPNGRHFAIRSLAIREKPFTLYAINEEGLFASTDRGTTWNALSDERDDLQVVAFEAPSRLHVAANGANYLRSEDGGKSWEATSQQWPHFSDFYLASGTVYATSSDAMWFSKDGGKSWQRIDEHPLRSIVVAPKALFAASSRDAVLSSSDGGKTWIERRLPPVDSASLRTRDRDE